MANLKPSSWPFFTMPPTFSAAMVVYMYGASSLVLVAEGDEGLSIYIADSTFNTKCMEQSIW